MDLQRIKKNGRHAFVPIGLQQYSKGVFIAGRKTPLGLSVCHNIKGLAVKARKSSFCLQ